MIGTAQSRYVRMSAPRAPWTDAGRRVWNPPRRVAGYAALIALVTLTACGGNKPAATGAAGAGGAMQAMPVRIMEAQPTSVPEASTYVASIQSLSSTVISPLVSGIIRQLYVKSGDHVHPGQPLLLLDPSLQQATVQNLENSRSALTSTLTFDRQQLARAKQLYEEKIGTLQDYQSALSTYNTAQAQIQSLNAQIQQAKVTLSYYTVTAPRSGIVGDIPVRLGDQVTTATQLTTIDSPTDLQVYVQVPIAESGRLRIGLPIQVLDGQGNLIANTQIGFISPQVDNTTQTILIKGDIANPRQPVRTQEYVQAKLTWGATQAYLVPVLSVQHSGGQPFVFLAAPRGEGYYAHQIPVETGVVTGNNVPVTSGLTSGDKIIVSSTQLLREGMPVVPMPAGAGAGGPGGPGSPAGPGAGSPGAKPTAQSAQKPGAKR